MKNMENKLMLQHDPERFILPDTKKIYYAFFIQRELYQKAAVMGYDNAVLFERETFTDDEISEIRKKWKTNGFIYFGTENDERVTRLTAQLESEMLDSFSYNIMRYLPESGDNIDSLESAVKNLPEQKSLEKILVGRDFIKDTDYTNRCGNCHKYMNDDDKYCKHCGTKKGEGEFLPFKNEFYGVYGPPIKKKYKCKSCGKIWIINDSFNVGSDYCGQCGRENPELIEHRLTDRPWGAVGIAKPFDNESRPVLLSDESVRKLLKFREKEEIDEHINYFYDKTIEILKKAGADVPNKYEPGEYPHTEEEEERLILAGKILRLKGIRFQKKSCPHCGTEKTAAIAYTLCDDRYNTIKEKICSSECEKHIGGLYFKNYSIRKKDIEEGIPSYLCLRCGLEFGRFEL